MSLYYNGDLEKDLAQINEFPGEAECAELLDQIGKKIGYARSQQMLQILWARSLKEQGFPPSGALFR